ncbi:Uncharacterised protein [Vibrio cholerae]|nr:Uncharacterised protein [Vibrio cholerae]CSI50828.1 Uncharacterised protein [Vibrio cholerae]
MANACWKMLSSGISSSTATNNRANAIKLHFTHGFSPTRKG